MATCSVGFLQHVTSLISKLLPTLQNTADTAAHRPAHGEDWLHRTVATYLLELWCCLFQFWPGSKLSDRSLATTLAPVASLAIALIRAVPNNAAPVDSNGSGVRRVDGAKQHGEVYCDSLTSEDLWSDCCHISLRLAHCLLCVVRKECCPGPDTSMHNSSYGSTAEAALASADVQRLMLLGLGATAAVMHRQQASSAASAVAARHTANKEAQQDGQQQQSNYSHMQLLAGLGISDSNRFIESALVRDAALIVEGLSHAGFQHHMDLAVVHLYNKYCDRQQGEDISIAGSSSSEGAATSLVLRQQAVPVLETLKDLALLQQDDDADSVGRNIWVFGSVCRAVMKQRCFDTKDLQQVLHWQLQPLYQKMCKVLCNLSQQQPTTGSPDSDVAELRFELTRTWAVSVQMFLSLSGKCSTGLSLYRSPYVCAACRLSHTAVSK